ncbi:MAG: hypothetical protein BZY88_17800 [SAR202 cluster bacterium Io17-Chloro-G9]|nr:MAG: hypothetical protein BZY88_17800 [SAR202 cluster bacterium Io17-Chloro-G9]
MTTASQLYSLQAFDLALDEIDLQKNQAQRELETGIASDQLVLALQAETDGLEEVRRQHREEQVGAETQRERSAELDRQLYGGELTNPRDLESLEREAANARNLSQDRETKLLELSLRAEEHRNKCEQLEKQLADLKAGWESRSAQLAEKISGWSTEREALADQRGNLASTFEPIVVQKYEVLRKAKSGTAVAKVLRGLCQGCQMSLPTQQQQQVRSGRQTVLCSSCGRMLCIG